MTDDTTRETNASFTDLRGMEYTVEVGTEEYSEAQERAKDAADEAGRATDALNRTSIRSGLPFVKALVGSAIALIRLKWRLHRLDQQPADVEMRNPWDSR